MFRKTLGVLGLFGGAATAGFLALTTTGLLQSEDLRTKAYRDPVGIPTVCVGETKGVRMGDTHTRQECLDMLQDRIVQFDKELGRCIHVKVPEETRSAIVQWGYNVGVGAACKSTLVRKLNAGDTEGACNELPRWVYATQTSKIAGKTVRKRITLPGLVTRRQHERNLCLAGIGK